MLTFSMSLSIDIDAGPLGMLAREALLTFQVPTGDNALLAQPAKTVTNKQPSNEIFLRVFITKSDYNFNQSGQL